MTVSLRANTMSSRTESLENQGLLTTGCTTTSLSDIYIISLSYQLSSFSAPDTTDNATVSAAFDITSNASSIQEVRVGYFGLCVRTDSGSWICDTSTLNLIRTLDDASQTDPLNLIWAGNQFQTEAVTSIFLYVSVTLVSIISI